MRAVVLSTRACGLHVHTALLTLDDDAVLDNLVSATQDAALIESFSPGDPRYKVFSPLHVGDVTQRKFNKKSSS